MTKYCTKCGSQNDETSQYCANCQAPLPNVGYQPMQGLIRER